MNTREIVRDVETILTNAGITYSRPTRREIIESAVGTGYKSGPGRLLYDLDSRREELAAALTGESEELHGWPECDCTGCDCTELATTTDDGGVPVCADCVEYAVDEDGDVICGKSPDSDRLETVTESCGAGGQTRSYVRLLPPEEPETDDDGQYALWWETVGDDAHLVARYATIDAAQQALAAKDWPPPGDHTNYLCGYGVRELTDGEWQQIEE